MRRYSWIALAIFCLVFSWYYCLVIAPAGYRSAGRGLLKDLYPLWNGSRHVLITRSNPYASSVTTQNQSEMYGRDMASPMLQQDAYPVFAAFPIAPLALLPFRIAQWAAFIIFLALTAISVLWWSGRTNVVPGTLFVLGAYPVIVALQLRQPTLLFAALMAAATASVRSRPRLAGVLLALATAKPQLALAACVPLLFWAAASWRKLGRSFFISFVASEAVLLCAAEFLVPGWFPQWLTVLGSYMHDNASSLVVQWFGVSAGTAISLLFAAAALVVGWRWREDPLFTVGFFIAALQLIMPFQLYNSVMLLAPLCWLACHQTEVRSCGGVQQLLLAAVWMAVGEEFFVVSVLGMIGMLNQQLAVRFWQFPFVFILFLPFLVFATLLSYVVQAIRVKPGSAPGCRDAVLAEGRRL